MVGTNCTSCHSHHGTSSNDVEVALGVVIGFIIFAFIATMYLFFPGDSVEETVQDDIEKPSGESIKSGRSIKSTKVTQKADFDFLEVEDIEDQNLNESIKKKPERQNTWNNRSNF